MSFSKRVAVVVAHGMGQQIPFETLDSVATGLINAAKERGDKSAAQYRIGRLRLGNADLARVELELTNSGESTHVDIYEAYWAPLTEGQIGIKEVIAFLSRAGTNGLQRGVQRFERWIFGSPQPLEPPIRTLIYILVALWTVAALVVLNAVVVAVAAARALFSSSGTWLTPMLLSDLTFVFSSVFVAIALFGVALGTSKMTHRTFIGPALRFLSLGLFVVTVFVIIMAGVAIPFVANYHATIRLAHNLFPTGLSDWTSITLAWLLGLCLLTAAILLLSTIMYRLYKQPSLFSSIVTLIFAVLLLLIAIEIGCLMTQQTSLQLTPMTLTAQWALIWAVLIIVSGFIRTILIQYLGDVAIYVQPHALDRFYDLRNRIKNSVRDAVQPVYAMKDVNGNSLYDGVYWVGHSLGSVIAYDTLNTLLRDDAAPPTPLRVKERTKLLLTFGSPLDKTAFFFATQRKRQGTNIREQLAASIQPIIEDATVRSFPWINVYSPWDIISGHLDYYDAPTAPKQNRVENFVDQDANTFLWAHVEYWQNPLVFRVLHEHITR